MKLVAALIVLSPLMLSACASSPTFEKSSNGGNGYVVKDSRDQHVFDIDLLLPINVADSVRRDYGFRAVGEECAARGFQFFDVAEDLKQHFTGLCYATEAHKALGITFKKESLALTPPRFIVGDLNGKTASQLKVDDEVVSFDGQKLLSMGQVKIFVFNASLTSAAVSLNLVRGGKPLKVNEPVAVFSSGLYTSKDLSRR